jgi:hypothetical protein
MTRVRPAFVIMLALTISAAIMSLASCESAGTPTPPPIGTRGDPTVAGGTAMDEPCPWDGACASLEIIDECVDGWAVACGDGFRCVDTEAEAGIICVGDGSSSSSGGCP